MANRKDALPIQLSQRQRRLLDRLRRQRTCPHSLLQRVHIVLDAADGRANMAIVRERGISDFAVRRWRQRFHDALPRLRKLEAEEQADDRALVKALVEALADKPRSGRPPVFSAEELTAVIAIACQKPEDSDRPVSHWTAREVADEAVKRGIVTSISRRHVGRFLKSGGSETASLPLLAESGNPEPG